MLELTEKQELACQAYIECNGNQSEAYRRAYDCDNSLPETIWQEASRLFNLPHVTARVIMLQEEHRERHNVTVDTLTTELDEAREVAREEKQGSAMTSATMGKAKLHGLITEKREITAKIDMTKLTQYQLDYIKEHGELPPA